MITNENDPKKWGQLKAYWLQHGGEYIQVGGTTYRVFTPDGKEFPRFLPQNVGLDAYSKTSTGVVQGAEPKDPMRSTTIQNGKVTPISDVD